jgi:hypothetical protein
MGLVVLLTRRREATKGEVEGRGKRSEERERMGKPEFSFSPKNLRGFA